MALPVDFTKADGEVTLGGTEDALGGAPAGRTVGGGKEPAGGVLPVPESLGLRFSSDSEEEESIGARTVLSLISSGALTRYIEPGENRKRNYK